MPETEAKFRIPFGQLIKLTLPEFSNHKAKTERRSAGNRKPIRWKNAEMRPPRWFRRCFSAVVVVVVGAMQPWRIFVDGMTLARLFGVIVIEQRQRNSCARISASSLVNSFLFMPLPRKLGYCPIRWQFVGQIH